MKDEPDIIKELREAEKLGLLQNRIQNVYEEVDKEDESIEQKSEQSSQMIWKHKLETNDEIIENIGENFQKIFENYAVAITLVDKKERIISWNKYAEELFNITESEFYLKPISSLYPHEEWMKIRKENVRQKGIKYHMETKMICKNQGLLDVELSLCILKGRDGETVGSIGIIKDITKLKDTEKKLNASEKRYRTIFENSAVALMLADEKERIISWNKYAEKLLSMKKEDLYLKPVKSLYPPEEWKKIRSQNIRQKGLQYHMESKILDKKNEVIDINLSLSVLKNHDENVIGSIGVIQDISNQKKAEIELKNSEQKFKQLYEHAPVPYHTISPTGIITDVNQKWCEVFEYSKQDVIGKPVFNFIIDEEKDEAKSSFNKKLKDKKLYTGGHERSFITRAGKKKTFVIHDYIQYDRDNKAESIQTILEDITERKQAEEKIKKLNIELKNKIAEIDNIDKLLKKKNDFVNQLGHDLKTPITILMNLIPLINEEVKNPNAKKDCDTAIRNLIYIKKLVKEILKITKLSSTVEKLEKKDIQLNNLINEILSNNEIIFHVKNIKIKKFFKKSITVNIDEMKIKEVLFNLINNAIKFTPENGEIKLKTTEKKDFVTVSITDNGIGMEKEQLQYIFNDFYKTDVSKHNLEGSGLGLSICKKIIEKHGGKIWAESPGPGKGSTFYFSIKK